MMSSLSPASHVIIPPRMRDVLHKLIAHEDLTVGETQAAFERLMTGQESEVTIAALLTALAVKGVSVDELVGVVRVMRSKLVPIPVDPIMPILDTCGTGGASKNVFGISTATSLLVAACGQKVCKHGNRAASGKFGSADVLEKLGVSLELSPEQLGQSLDETNFCFAFARNHNPAMKHVAPVRTALGVPTIFNLCGPLTNPAGARYQLMGVYSAHLLEIIPQALVALGTRKAWVVLSEDGLGELSTTAPTLVAEVAGGEILNYVFDAQQLGFKRATIDDFRVSDADESAKVIQDIFKGKKGPCRDIVVLNAAAGLVVTNFVDDLPQGIALAHAAIDSGQARDTLEKVRQFKGTR